MHLTDYGDDYTCSQICSWIEEDLNVWISKFDQVGHNERNDNDTCNEKGYKGMDASKVLRTK